MNLEKRLPTKPRDSSNLTGEKQSSVEESPVKQKKYQDDLGMLQSEQLLTFPINNKAHDQDAIENFMGNYKD